MPAFEAAIFDDLAWLGLIWEEPIRRQSAHMADYAAPLARLRELGLLYPCFCTRREIRAEIARSGQAPHGPDGPLYPGTCKRLDPARRQDRLAAGHDHALRLDAARGGAAGPMTWHDRTQGAQTAETAAFRRRGPGAQGGGHQLSLGGHRGRRPARRHLGHPGRGSVPGHAHPPPAASTVRSAGAGVATPRPAGGRGRQPPGQAQRCPIHPRLRAAGHTPAQVRAMAGFVD